MSACEAIKTKSEIQSVEEFLMKHYGTHYSDIWRLGINLALRISDMLNITMMDAKVALEKDYLVIQEQKTRNIKGKETRVIKLNSISHRILKRRIEESPSDIYLFQSHCRNMGERISPLTRQGVYTAFREAGRAISVRMGTHSMRKTRGYMMYIKGIPLEMICKMFNHSHPAVTMRYIGLTQEALDKTYEDIEL